MSFFGWLFIVVGVAACCYFLFIYDTTRTPKFPAGSTERIYNQGLMQNRQLGAIGGMALTIIGTMMVIAVPAKQ